MASDNAKTALLCAFTLASAKEYAKAEGLILSDAELAKTPEAMDLLARIRVEQGDLAEARRLWQEIQALHPEHRPSALALRNLDKPPRRPMRFGWLCVLVAVLGVALGAVLARLLPQRDAGLREIRRIHVQGIPTAQTMAELAALKGQVRRVDLRSDFFADPARMAHRSVLIGLVSEALTLPPSEVYISSAPEGSPEGTFTASCYR